MSSINKDCLRGIIVSKFREAIRFQQTDQSYTLQKWTATQWAEKWQQFDAKISRVESNLDELNKPLFEVAFVSLRISG